MSELMVLLCWSGLCYVLGGLHGLYLGWSQEWRIQQWAIRAAELHQKVKDAEARGAERTVF